MTGNQTKPYRNTLSGSIGSGMGSLFAPGGRTYYILEHKVSSRYHQAGESQEIIVDNIEIGRDARCQVRFDERFTTVSRHHAGIVRDGDMWKLVQISKTNSTLLNGRQVQTEWYLQNGDEIQLSVNGPKLGFIIPTGKKSTVGSIGLTRRLSLFRQQALRPYKQAITALACVLVLAIGGLGGWNWHLRHQLTATNESLAEQIEQAKGNKAQIDSLSNQLVAANQEISATQGKLDEARREAKQARAMAVKVRQDMGKLVADEDIKSLMPHVYYVMCVPIINGEEYDAFSWSGTGFMLSNGCFVTAQHVIHADGIATTSTSDGIAINPEHPQNYLNELYFHGDVTVRMMCISSDGGFEVKYTYKDNPFRMGNAGMAAGTFYDENNAQHVVRIHDYDEGTDWACVQAQQPGSGLAFDPQYSVSMPAQTKLFIAGFPAGQAATQSGEVSPVISQAVTSRDGLEDNRTIKTSNDDSDHGNSGGPVFALKDGKYVVVGILNGADPGSDATHRKGRVTPIGSLFN